MRDQGHDDRVNARVNAINASATYHGIVADAAEAAGVARGVQRPLPTLPTDPSQREAVLTILLLQSRARERRLLAMLSG